LVCEGYFILKIDVFTAEAVTDNHHGPSTTERNADDAAYFWGVYADVAGGTKYLHGRKLRHEHCATMVPKS
jgi:hypothetical protein